MDGVLLNSLNASVVRAFVAVRIELPNNTTINLIDGAGTVTFPVNGVPITFTGRDAVYGTLAVVGSISEQIAQESPTFSVSLFPPDTNGAALLCQPINQESPIHVWFGTVNEATGAAIGAPERLWSGRLDTANFNSGDDIHIVEIDTVSAFDRLFAAEEDTRLNGTWHRSVWPGEGGLDHVVSGLRNVPWGVAGPVRGGSSSVTPGGAGGGGNARLYDFVFNIANH